MCGISGLINFRSSLGSELNSFTANSEALARMTAVQSHRGPDDSGLWERHFPDGTYIGLGSRRLAILDLSADGHMPMGNETMPTGMTSGSKTTGDNASNEDGSVWITFNGEIYNFAELRREVESKGHCFRSHTDTEAIIHLYEEYGVECLHRLNGMFAFAICDLRGSSPRVFLARDHFGIKPLYYFEGSGSLAFASEIKALLEVPGIEARMSLEALHQYLTFLWVPDPATMFEGIKKLEAGQYAIWQQGGFRVEQYWDLSFPPGDYRFERDERDLQNEIRERFCASVEQQMVSDVPIGAFLSAGLDSSSIVAAMARKQPVRTYTITFPKKYRIGENTIDDPGVPRRLAQRLSREHHEVEHHEISVEPDVVSLLPRLTWHMDEPTGDPALITAYLVCREARKQATVLLSGVGGDELFAGYRKHIAAAWAQEYRRLPGTARTAVEKAALALPGMRGTGMKGHVRLAKKMARSAALNSAEAFIRNCTYLDAQQKSDLYSPVLQNLISLNPSARHQSAFGKVRHADFLNQMLYLDTKIFMTTLNLTYNDKMSMASSVEVRVPFLDRTFAEFVAWNVKPEWKLKGKWRPVTKHIFREAMRGMLPQEVLGQPKAGFAAPVDYWLAHDLRPVVDDLLSESQVRRRGMFKPEVVRRYVDEHRRGAEDWSMQVWQLLTLETWMQLFIDGGARGFARERFVQEKLTSPQLATA
ncbi:MAG TPA: asparagine synthase (glutamine-hydrolyzing) [Terriglobales bacterium]|nr:asparagine synthase (glutamine-hydrolyzing) [Terriglobales bacterium]